MSLLTKLTSQEGFIKPHGFDKYVPKLNGLAKEHSLYNSVPEFRFESVGEDLNREPRYFYDTSIDSTEKEISLADKLSGEVIVAFERWYLENH